MTLKCRLLRLARAFFEPVTVPAAHVGKRESEESESELHHSILERHV